MPNRQMQLTLRTRLVCELPLRCELRLEFQLIFSTNKCHILGFRGNNFLSPYDITSYCF